MPKFDQENCFEFLRYLHTNRKPTPTHEQIAGFESIIARMRANPTQEWMYGLKAALEAPEIDSGDFLAGLMVGVSVCSSSGHTGRGSVAEFLETWRLEKSKNGEKVVDIAEAFRKRQQS